MKKLYKLTAKRLKGIAGTTNIASAKITSMLLNDRTLYSNTGYEIREGSIIRKWNLPNND